jgi:glycosyltransferase involved in cell wall biosynthesis
MRILYLSTSYVPSRRASGIHVMRMCQALARSGHQVTLAAKGCPQREEPGVADVFAFYGVLPVFELRKLPHPAPRGGGLVFAAHARRLLVQMRSECDLVYSRDLVGGWLALRAGLPLVFEAHGLPEGVLGSFLWRKVVRSPGLLRLVVISEALRAILLDGGLLPAGAWPLVAHDGADAVAGLDAAVTLVPTADVGNEGTSVGYVGSLYAGRGVDVVVELAARLPSNRFHVIGGSERDLEGWRSRATPPNLAFHGFVPPEKLAAWYAHLEVLLMPYQRRVAVATGESDTSRWMSPMKMFEYMAAGKAIVASDLPVLREVLKDGRNALLVPPDDLGGWERAVRRLLGDRDLARRLGAQARADLEGSYTWEARARKVLDGLGPRVTPPIGEGGSSE